MASTLNSILHVDDDLHARTTVKLVLEVIGKFTADLILLDVMMPGLDGLDALAMLRRIPDLAATPALFVTSLTGADDMAGYVNAGAVGMIPKPLMPPRLTGQLNSLWEQHAALCQTARLRGADDVVRVGTCASAMMANVRRRGAINHLRGRDQHENQGSDCMEGGPSADN